MKKHLLFLCSAVFLLFFSSQAQVFSKKDRLFGAATAISFYVNNQSPNLTNQYSSNIALIPSIGWAIKDNLVAGIKAGIGYARSAGSFQGAKSVLTTLQIGPEIFIRKYKLLSKDFGVTFEHKVSGFYYLSKNRNSPSGDSKSSAWGGGYNFTPGAFYKFSDRFLGEANFGGLFLNGSSTGDGRNSFSVGATFLTYFNMGIQYIIPAKKA